MADLARRLSENSHAKQKSVKQVIPPIQSPIEFGKMFLEIIEGKKKKLVIALDNLDRCEERLVTEMLSTVKSFMETKGVFFIIPCDENAIIEDIMHTRGLVKHSAKDFLRKFFQVSVIIPPIISGIMIEYVEYLVKKYNIPSNEGVNYVISVALIGNPRRIKQFLNHFIANYHLALEIEYNTLKEKTITGQPEFLAKILVLRDQFPDFYEELVKEENLLDNVERHFRKEPIIDYSGGALEKILSNINLRSFLSRTRRIQTKDIRPFLRLSQESYEKSEKYTEIKNLVRTSDFSEIKIILELTPDEEKYSIYQIIKNVVIEDFQKGRFEFGINDLDCLLHLIEEFPKEDQNDIINLFGMYAVSNEILENISNFNHELIFNIIPDIDKTNRDTIIEEYCSIISKREYNETFMDLILSKIELFSHKAIVLFGGSLREFYNNQEELANSVIQTKFKDKQELLPLITPALLDVVIGKISEGLDEVNKQRFKFYLQFKRIASNSNKNNFINKLLALIPKNPPPAISPAITFACEILMRLESVDLTESLATKIFEKLTHTENTIAEIKQKPVLLGPIFKLLESVPPETQKSFLESKIPTYVSWGDPPFTQLLECMKNSNINPLENEIVFTAFLGKAQKTTHVGTLSYLLQYCPETKIDKLTNFLVSSINSQNEGIRNSILNTIKDNSDNIPDADKIAQTMILKSRSFNSPFYEPFMESIEKIFVHTSSDVQNEIIDEFISTITKKDPGKINPVVNAIKTICNDSEPQQEKVIHQIIESLDINFNYDVNFQNLFKFIIENESKITDSDKSQFVDVLINLIDVSKPDGIKNIGLEILLGLKNIGKKSDDVKKALESITDEKNLKITKLIEQVSKKFNFNEVK